MPHRFGSCHLSGQDRCRTDSWGLLGNCPTFVCAAMKARASATTGPLSNPQICNRDRALRHDSWQGCRQRRVCRSSFAVRRRAGHVRARIRRTVNVGARRGDRGRRRLWLERSCASRGHVVRTRANAGSIKPRTCDSQGPNPAATTRPAVIQATAMRGCSDRRETWSRGESSIGLMDRRGTPDARPPTRLRSERRGESR